MLENMESAAAIRADAEGHQGILNLLDFCRGMAILWIIAVHAAHGGFGWQGVHVFVVLSGFTLVYARLTGNVKRSWREWYVRRAARILPTYWLVVIAGFLLVLLMDALAPVANNILSTSDHVWRLTADLTFLRNLSYRTMLADPNSALWFIGLAVSFYLAFPFLYSFVSNNQRAWALIGFLLCAVAAELAYRALAIFLLDGIPVGYGHGFLKFFGRVPRATEAVAPGFPFQLWAPFGIFFSRVGEYALGMVAAAALACSSGNFSRMLINRWSALAGLAVWLAGNALIYAGRSAWVFGDLVIAAGLIVWLLNLAEAARRGISPLFRVMSWLGVWSYYLFLTHLLVGYASARLYTLWSGSAFTVLLAYALVIALVVISCRLLRRLDQAEYPTMFFVDRSSPGGPSAKAL
ncbi:MAG: acyltransferase [Gemmatimonadaceae bacterium]|nr:acyltransferase [Gemmatimonadaceae bacterium]MDQ3520650.1 acyltransferase [Gemmatimonadota bacterium]